MLNLLNKFPPDIGLSDDVEKLLNEKKIYFTFAYVGELRCYKHNQLIWWAYAPLTKNKHNRYEMDYEHLVKAGKECVEFFVKNGYIPNLEVKV